MNHLEVVFNIKIFDEEKQDILIAYLLAFGFDSFHQKENTLHAFIDKNIFVKETLEDYLSKYFSIDIEKVLALEEKNWNSVWEESFEPIYIENQCCIRAPFHSKDEKIQYDIVITPKMSFGTGHHSTTMLMMKQITSLCQIFQTYYHRQKKCKKK